MLVSVLFLALLLLVFLFRLSLVPLVLVAGIRTGRGRIITMVT